MLWEIWIILSQETWKVKYSKFQNDKRNFFLNIPSKEDVRMGFLTPSQEKCKLEHFQLKNGKI